MIYCSEMLRMKRIRTLKISYPFTTFCIKLCCFSFLQPLSYQMTYPWISMLCHFLLSFFSKGIMQHGAAPLSFLSLSNLLKPQLRIKLHGTRLKVVIQIYQFFSGLISQKWSEDVKELWKHRVVFQSTFEDKLQKYFRQWKNLSLTLKNRGDK